MCLQDYQIGRLVRAEVRMVPTSSTTFELAPRNKDRVAITFAFGNPQGVNISPEIDAVLYEGFPLATEYSTLTPATVGNYYDWQVRHFTVQEYGDLPMRRWHGIATGTNYNVMVIEYILPEDVLSMTPEQLRLRAS